MTAKKEKMPNADGAGGSPVMTGDVTGLKRLEQEREQYLKFFQLSTDAMCIADPFGCFKHINPAFMRLTGYEERELVSKPFLDFVLPEDRQRTAEEMKLQVAVRPSLHFENRYVCKDGSVIRLSWTAYFDKKDGVTYASARDITELKRAEETLEASNEFSMSVIRSMQDGFSVLDVNGVTLDANPAFCRMTGFSREELVGVRTPYPYWPPEEYEPIQTAFVATLKGDFADFELTFMRKNGERFPVIVSPFVVRNSRGETISYSATVKDITERRQAEKLLRAREAEHRTILQTSMSGFWLADAQGRLIEVNDSYCRMSGYSERELLSMRIPDFEAVESAGETAAHIKKIMMTGEDRFESRHRRKDGSIFDVEVSVQFRAIDGGRFVAFLQDVTTRKRAEEILRESQEVAGLGHYNLNLVSWTWDSSTVLDDIFGLANDDTKNADLWLELLHPDDRARMWSYFNDEVLKGHKPFDAKYRIRRLKDGQVRWVHGLGRVKYDTAGQPLEMLGTIQDITSIREAENALRESEERFRAIFEQAAVGVAMIDSMTGRFLSVNQRTCDIARLTREQMLSATFMDITHPDDLQADLDYMEQLKAGVIRTFTMEKRYLHPDSSITWVNLTVSPMWAPGEAPTRHIAVVEDITARKRAEDALRENEEKFRTLFENSGDAILIMKGACLIDCNSRTLEMFGCSSRDQIVGHSSDKFWPAVQPDGRSSQELAMEKISAAMAGQSQSFEWVNMKLDGTTFPTDVILNTVLLGGEVLLQAIVRDISARKQAEKALREANQKLSLHFEQTPMAVIEWDLNFCVTRWNPAAEKIFGFSREEALSRHASFIIPKAFHEHVDGIWQALLKHSGGERSTNENVRKGGNAILCEWYNTPLIDDNGVVTGVASLVQDVTERKRAEEALRETNELFALFMRHSPIYTFIKSVTSTESRVLRASDNYQQMVGLSGIDMVGKTMEDLFPADLAVKITADDWAVVTSGEVLKVDEDFNGRNYTSIKFPITQGGKTLLAGYTIDITDLKQAQLEREQITRKMLEAQKLESLGVLAGGIAHDFNNLLTGIIGYTSLASMDLPPGSPVHTYLEPISKASARAAHLCKQMLAYSGKGRFVVQRLDLGHLVEETTQMLQLSISKKAVLRFHLEKGLPPIEADATQIHQVVMNLVINASEAIGDRSGVISISTGLTRVDRDYLHGTLMAPELPEGEYVFLEVADNGCGMSPETQARIFDPFFTTKFTGRGLGLAAVLGIVRGHKGALKVTSELGHGTTFKLLFPAVAGTIESSKASSTSTPDVAQWQGKGSVLVVDDEETVRSTLVSMMKFMGLDPVLASDGQEAVNVFSADPGRFALVLLDLTMPHVDGQQAFVELRRIRPDVRVVLMSGFSQKDALSRFPDKGPESFLQKPFRMESLREVLRGALG